MQRTKSRVFSYLILIIVLLIFLSNVKNADAGEFTCEGNVFIEIVVPDDRMHGYICTASGKAIEFLAQ